MHDRYRRSLADLLERALQSPVSAEQLNREFVPSKESIYELERRAEALLVESRDEQDRLRAALSRHGRRAFWMLVAFASASVGLVSWLLLQHARYIEGGLRAFSARIEDLASARRLLSDDLSWPRQDELGEIMSKMNGLLHTLRALYERVADGERSLDVTIRALGDGLLAVDVEGRVTRLNPVAESLTGVREQEALGKPLEEVLTFIDAQTRAPATIALRRSTRTCPQGSCSAPATATSAPSRIPCDRSAARRARTSAR
jgi:PAS domain-containing protein